MIDKAILESLPQTINGNKISVSYNGKTYSKFTNGIAGNVWFEDMAQTASNVITETNQTDNQTNSNYFYIGLAVLAIVILRK